MNAKTGPTDRIPADWLPDAAIHAIVLHWSGGAWDANSLDCEHYHIMVQEDGSYVRGDHSIKDNAPIVGDNYAAHTLHFNSDTIGLSAMCMLDAVQGGSSGRYPLTERQALRMAAAAAQLCVRYQIIPTRTTVLAHGEVQHNLGIQQRQKWDPLVLPWDLSLTPSQVGDWWRARIVEAIKKLSPGQIPSAPVQKLTPDPDTARPQIVVKAGSAPVMGFLEDGAAWVPVRLVSAQLGYLITHVAQVSDEATVSLTPNGNPGNQQVSIRGIVVDGTTFVKARSLATVTGFSLDWYSETKTLVFRK